MTTGRGTAIDLRVFGQALVLAALAGAVDAIGYLHWHGLFPSFMSGNSTILGASAARADWAGTVISAAVIAGFVSGVVAGELLGAAFGAGARPGILAVEAVLLGLGAAASRLDVPELLAAPLLSFAMGVQNAAIRRAGGMAVALTYVTGTLVTAGRKLAAALRGEGPPSAALPYLALWCSLAAGAAIGALATTRSEPIAIAGAAGVSVALAVIAALTQTTEEMDEHAIG